jgi:hypothetical protein
VKRYALAASAAVVVLMLIAPCGSALAGDQGPVAKDAPVGTFRIEQIIHFSLDEGWLTAEPASVDPLMTGEEMPIRITGSRALWSIRASTAGTPSDDRFIELSYRDRGEASEEGNCQATVQCRSGYTSISGTHRRGGETIYVLYRAWHEAQTVQVEAYIQEGGELTRTLLNARGSNLLEIWAEHPADTNRYLGPVLRKVARRNILGPGWSDVYSVFTKLEADSSTTQRLMRLLPRLDALSPATRKAASAELARMGRAGLLSAMRLGDVPLTPEQKARLGEFINTNHRRGTDELEQAGHDIPFLLECLDDDEVTVRQAARDSIQATIGRPISFDCQLDGDDRADAITALENAIRDGAHAQALARPAATR